MRARGWIGAIVVLASLSGCGGGGGGSDGGRRDGSGTCVSDRDCDDGAFCNGVEVCDPSSMAADDRGCRPAPPPCPPGRCNESDNSCSDDPCPDEDGDGHRDAECGGDDCDDADPTRFPGNTEVCDDENVDEDCDPTTFGERDEDGDGWVSSSCCNGDVCGEDCDDSVRSTNPTAPEVCDGIDNDCDGTVDEGVLVEAYPDEDADGWGDADATPDLLCSLPTGDADRGGDCADDDPTRHPGALEECDAIDNDCDGRVDEGGDLLCSARGGEGSEWACLSAADGSGAACRSIACQPGWLDCNGDPADGCEANLCDDADTCGSCGTSCIDCSGGLCASGPPPPPDLLSSGTVVRDADSMPLSGVEITPFGMCAGSTFSTDDAGEYSFGTVREPDWLLFELDGYLPLIPWGDAEEAMVERVTFDDWLADDDVTWEQDPEAGIVLVDVVDLGGNEVVVDVPSSPALEITADDVVPAEAHSGAARVLITNVSPGSVEVSVENASPFCFVACDPGGGSQQVRVRRGTITRVVFGSCVVACV